MNDNNDDKNVFKTLNWKSIILPVFIGVAVVVFLISRDESFTRENLLLIKNIKPIGFLGALLMIFIRDFLYVYRIRLLVNKEIPWLNCFIIIALWEFSSSVTPSVIGGGFVATFLFIHEGISFGRAIAYVMVTATFDNYFFLLVSPFGFLASGIDSTITESIFILSYIFIFFYSTLMTITLFLKPQLLGSLMDKITNIGFLKKYKKGAIKNGNEMIVASKVLKKQGLNFWIYILFITLITWISRYIILNFLIEGFISCNIEQHFNILCKHLIMWVTMLISPTPGGSGFIEYFFNDFYKDILKDYTIIISILWRIMTYYVYLILGIIILPSWIKTFKSKNKNKIKKNIDE